MFLDDMASPELRNAAKEAKLAGFQMAANPPAPGEPGQGQQAGQSPSKAAPQEDEEEEEETPPAKQKQPAPKRDTMAALERLIERLERRLGEEDHHGGSPEEPGVLGRTSEAATGGADATDSVALDDALLQRELSQEWRRWRHRALDDIKAGKPFRGFTTTLISPVIHEGISKSLQLCKTADHVRAVFGRAEEMIDPGRVYDPVSDEWRVFEMMEGAA
jgi:hypothetical protein